MPCIIKITHPLSNSFSENMLRYPSPQMIINYTDANLMMLTDNKNTPQLRPSGEDL